MRGAGQEQHDATEHGSEEDPRGTTAEPGTGTIGEVAEHQVGDQRDATAVKALTTPTKASGLTPGMVFVVHRQQHCGDDAEAGHPQETEDDEAGSEAEHGHLVQRFAGLRR